MDATKRPKDRTSDDYQTLKDTAEAAEILGMSRSWLDHDRQKIQPDIPFVRVGRRAVRYRVSDLLAYAESRVGKPFIPEDR
jgi:predicted DNA-binding transcriptional regulator AlpA